MSNQSANNKRIAKNTVYLYIRMFISMSVSLYTSRVILQTLGVEDYGVYNVVGGVVAMFSFINATMSSATSRFLTFELGKGTTDKLKETFNSSFWVHVIIAVIIFLLSETIGLWFLVNKMVIPEGREMAAHIVYQLSILSTIISIIQVPYNATLIAHEKMDIYAYVEMLNVFLRLLILYILVLVDFDKLILHGILTMAVSTGISAFYRFYCVRNYLECRIRFGVKNEVIKPMLSFSGWDFYGNMTVTARTQGVSMLLNVFFGPIMNAAAGISASVQTAVMAFAGNVNTAVRPQIIKYYAIGEYPKMESLINTACKLNFLVMAMLIVPICFEIDYIFKIWLGNVPPMSNIFCILTLSFNLFANMSFLVNLGNHAAGKIFRPSVINGTLYIMVIPISYISYRLGGPAWIPYLFNLVAVVFGMLSNVYTLHLNVPEYSPMIFIRNVLKQCVFTIAIGIFAGCIVRGLLDESFIRLVVTCVISTFFMGLFGWHVMLSSAIRSNVVSKIKKLCRKV